MMDKKLNTNYGITRMMRKLKALKKKITGRHRDKPEENMDTINKKNSEKDRQRIEILPRNSMRTDDPVQDEAFSSGEKSPDSIQFIPLSKRL